jgi:hypothetical protein
MHTCFYCKHYLGNADDNGVTGKCQEFNVVKLHNDGSRCKSFDYSNNEDKEDGK